MSVFEQIINEKNEELRRLGNFFSFFQKWQNRFPCPKCKGCHLDFIINQNIKYPFICTNCHTYFKFQKVITKNMDGNVK